MKTKRALCIVAAASFLLAAPTAAWSWPLSDEQSPSDEAGKLTLSDLSSATETEVRRLTPWRPANKRPAGMSPGLRPTKRPAKICLPKCGGCQKCVNGKCIQDKKKDGTGCIDGNKCIIDAKCWDGKCQGGTSKACGDCKKCNALTGKCSADKNQNGSPCDDGQLCIIGSQCSNGICEGGNAKPCDTCQECDPASGTCISLSGCGSPGPCNLITVDFDKAADGTPIKRGDYVRNQWKSLGLTLFAEGGLSKSKGNMPRVFDTKNPGNETVGDPDLGAPNERCNPAGPGIGEGGEPEKGNKGVNCAPQGNALIIQEVNNWPDVPDDAADGGNITLDFPDAGGRYVSDIGLLDVDEAASVVVTYENEEGDFTEKVIQVPILGDNSFQVVKIDINRVRWIKVMMTGSGAVTFIEFCSEPILTSPPVETSPPTRSPTKSPTASPSGSSAIISGTVSAIGGAPLKDVPLELLNSAGNVVRTTKTGSNGKYEFAGLLPGNYIVKETNPPGYSINVSDQDNSFDGDEGDSDTTVNNLIAVTLADGEEDKDNDFVDDRIPTAPPTRFPTESPTPTPTPPPTEKPTRAPTTPPSARPTKSPTVSPTASSTGSPTTSPTGTTAAISGTVRAENGPPLEGVLLMLLDSSDEMLATTTTGSNGKYEFAGLPPGDYLVKETNPPEYTINISDQDSSFDGDQGDSNTTVDNLIAVTLADGEEDKDNDFVDDRIPTAPPTRSPTESPTPTPTPPPTEKPSRAPMTPPSARPTKSPTVSPTASSTGSPTTSPTGTTAVISGTVRAENGPPLEGVLLMLLDSPDEMLATTTTTSNGKYEFAGLPPGDYLVKETNPTGYTINVSDQDNSFDGDKGDSNTTVDNLIAVTLADGEEDKDNDFVDAHPETEAPTDLRTASPTRLPTRAPASTAPSDSPSESASASPAPSDSPSESPSASPAPSDSPSESPNAGPAPSDSPSGSPSASPAPSNSPSEPQSASPAPSDSPSESPSTSPAPSDSPSESPTEAQTPKPTKPPTPKPTKAPIPKQTKAPTPKPNKAPTPAPTKSAGVCDSVTVDFDKAADGTPIKRGDYVRDQWKSLGLTLFAKGGLSESKGNMPRIFDTANPGTGEEAGDPDLGAPNVKCTPAGPGTGVGGEPGKEGVNCRAQGNVLIVQEANKWPDVPDDNADGGTITFDFPDGKYVNEIGLLDVDYASSLVIIYENDKGNNIEKVIKVPLLGDNSFQIVKVDTDRVKWIKFIMARSGAVTFIKFCP